MLECPRVIKHQNSKDVAFLAASCIECDKDGKKGFAVYGIWIIISTNRDYLSESGMVFIQTDELKDWHDYVPRN